MKAVPLYHVWNYSDVDRRFWEEHLAYWLPHSIIDAHTHVNEPKFRRETPTDEMRRQYWVSEVNDPIGAIDAERCYRTVFPDREFSCLAFGYPDLGFDIEASNEALRLNALRNGWSTLAVVRPQWSEETISRILERDGVIGVKVYYALISEDRTTRDRHLEASIFDFLPHHQLRVLNERKAWVTLHVPKADRLGHPDNIREIRQIRDRYPDVTLVIAHLGRCYTLSHAEEALPQLAGDPGLFFDNSAVLNPEVHRFAFSVLGPERVLYGTDNPIFYMRGRRQWEGRTYVNRTSYPFHFNTERESPEIESTYTLYMYEALRAIKDAATDLSLSREDIAMTFAGNARRLIRRAASGRSAGSE